MRAHHRPSTIIGLLVSFALAGGCTPLRMLLDPGLKTNAPEQPTSGMAGAQFRRPVTFGPYQATVTKGGVQSSSKVGAGPWKREGVEQSFEFTFTGGAVAWTGECSFDASRHSVIITVSEEIGFICTLQPEGGTPWQLHLERTIEGGGWQKQKSLKGSMSDGTTTFAIAMSRQIEGGSFPMDAPVGYEFRDAGKTQIGAVQVMNTPIVWIDPSLPADQQTAIAAGAFGLMMSSSAADKTTKR